MERIFLRGGVIAAGLSMQDIQQSRKDGEEDGKQWGLAAAAQTFRHHGLESGLLLTRCHRGVSGNLPPPRAPPCPQATGYATLLQQCLGSWGTIIPREWYIWDSSFVGVHLFTHPS